MRPPAACADNFASGEPLVTTVHFCTTGTLPSSRSTSTFNFPRSTQPPISSISARVSVGAALGVTGGVSGGDSPAAVALGVSGGASDALGLGAGVVAAAGAGEGVGEGVCAKRAAAAKVKPAAAPKPRNIRPLLDFVTPCG